MVYVHIRPFARSFHSIAFHYIEYMGVIEASVYPSFGAQKKWQSKWEQNNGNSFHKIHIILLQYGYQ